MSFNKIEINEYDDLLREKTMFFEKNQVKTLYINNVKWTYIIAGQGERTIVFAPGMIGKKDLFIKYFNTLSESYKVISFDYPVVDSITELVKGIIKIINYEMLEDIIFFGQDFGGILGQLIVKEDSERIDSLILFNSSTATENIPSKNIKRNINNLKKLESKAKGFGFNSYKKKLIKDLQKGISISGVKNPEQWSVYYERILIETTKEEMLSIYRAIIEFWKSIRFTQKDFENYKGEVLNIESEVDKFNHLEEIQEIKNLFQKINTFQIKGSRNMAIERNRHEIIGKLIPYIDGISLRKK